eukprot:188756_1
MFFFMTSAFYFLIIVTTLAWTFRMIFLCTSDDLTRIFVLIGGPTYTFQYLLLFYILFYRIILVFKGTAYGLQKRTICFLHVYIIVLLRFGWLIPWFCPQAIETAF